MTANRAGALVASLLWQRRDVPGMEHFQLWLDPAGPRLAGTVLAAHGGTPLRLDYEILCSPRWETRLLAATLVIEDVTRRLELVVDGRGRWRADGVEIAALAGCVDVDLSLSPSTNTLPIRRLGMLDLVEGESLDVTAAWVRLPDMRAEPLPQRYTRLPEGYFRYESRGGEFVAEVEVDDAGLVVAYPPFWTRVTS